MASRKSPWSWQPPPIPPSLSLLNPTSDPAPQLWHRPFWGIEGYSAMCTLQLPGVIDIVLSCQISPSPAGHPILDHQLIRSAVRALRFEHPTIASRYAWPAIRSGRPFGPEVGRFAYEVLHSECDVQLWLSEVVFDRSDILAGSISVEGAIASVRQELGRASASPPHAMFQLHHVPSRTGSHGIILRLAHTLFDGIGAFQVMDLFIAKLAQFLASGSSPALPLAWGEEVLRLAGPVPDRSKVPWSEEKLEQDCDMMKKLDEALGFAPQAHGIPIPNPNATPSTTGVFLRSMTPQALSDLLAVARMHGCSISNVMFAAEMLALLRVNPPTRKDDITTASYPSPFSLRAQHLMADPLDKTKWEVAGALGFNILFARDLGRFVAEAHDEKKLVGDVFMLAREVRAQMDEQRKYMGRASHWVHELMMAIAADTAERLREPTPTLSSLGVVDAHLAVSHAISSGGRVDVADPIFTVCAPYAPYMFPLIVHPYTWKDQLRISFSFPEAYMGSAADLVRSTGKTSSVLEVVDEFMDILVTVAESRKR